MKCRQCGTEIADKALICYRCGTATTEAQFKPASTSGRRFSRLFLIVVFLLGLLIALLAVFFTRAGFYGQIIITRGGDWGQIPICTTRAADPPHAIIAEGLVCRTSGDSGPIRGRRHAWP